jgi:hypothetical protein
MWGILSAYSNYIKVGLYALAICGIFFAGWHIRDNDFTIYKDQVRIAAEKQAAQTASVQKQQELVNKGIKDEYEDKLAALRNYYGRVQFNPSSSPMSGISPAPKGTDAETAYPILAGQCAETTLQVNLWQEWAAQNGLIK